MLINEVINSLLGYLGWNKYSSLSPGHTLASVLPP